MAITNYVASWLKRADEDLEVIELLLEKDGPASTICFHAQQAAEKYLKGFLAYHEKNVRKIHNLESLVKDCESFDETFNELLNDAKFLTQFYVETRYPGDIPDFTMVESRRAFEATKRTKEFVLQRLRSGDQV